MLVEIVETGELKSLVIYDLQNDPECTYKKEWTSDFIGDSYNRDKGVAVMDKDTYEWYLDRIAEHNAFFSYCKENGLDACQLLFSTSFQSDDLDTFYSGLLAEAQAIVKEVVR